MTKLKLSEAMRLGAMATAQHFHGMFDRDDQGKIVATCALGAADYAGYQFSQSVFPRNSVHERVVGSCPDVRCHYHRMVGGGDWILDAMIIHLNDYHQWSRERIADWVEGQEAAYEAGRSDATRGDAAPADVHGDVLVHAGAD